jgi:hypothetical protein
MDFDQNIEMLLQNAYLVADSAKNFTFLDGYLLYLITFTHLTQCHCWSSPAVALLLLSYNFVGLPHMKTHFFIYLRERKHFLPLSWSPLAAPPPPTGCLAWARCYRLCGACSIDCFVLAPRVIYLCNGELCCDSPTGFKCAMLGFSSVWQRSWVRRVNAQG